MELAITEVLSLLSALGGIGGLATIMGVAYWLGRKFAQVDERFKHIDNRFAQIDNRFKQIDNRFKQVDERFKQIDERFRQIDNRFEQINKRFEQTDNRFDGIENRLESMNLELKRISTRLGRMESHTLKLTRAIRSINEFMVDILGYEGVIREEAVKLIKREADRILSFTELNPLTKEEKIRLRELLKKDKLTLEEAEELYQIADKLVEEYGERIEPWKLLWYSRFWIAYNLGKMRKKANVKS